MTVTPERRQHWTETAERTCGSYGLPVIGLVAEDDYGDLRVPSLRRLNWWHERLDLRKPWHWPSYMRSRITRRLVMVEANP